MSDVWGGSPWEWLQAPEHIADAVWDETARIINARQSAAD